MNVCVIVPAYNATDTIVMAICTVLAQSHRHLRLIIVDDGSTDDTVLRAGVFADRRLTLITQPNAGVSAARNRGLAAANGDAVLFLDADDWLAVPWAIARLVAALEATPEAVAAVGPYARLGPHDPRRTVAYRASAAPRDLLPHLLTRNLFANGGHVLVRADAARGAGGFDPGLAYGEDWEFFIRLALLGPFAFVPTRQPVLVVLSRAEGAYRRRAADPAAFTPCMDAIFGNPDLLVRLGPHRLAAARRRADAENAWIIGREMVRQGRAAEGRRWLTRSVSTAPSLRRLVLFALAHGQALLPPQWLGPFRPYDRAMRG